MRKFLLRGVAIVILALLTLYAWPLWSAFQLRQALRSGSAAALEPRVEWPVLRANLRARIAENLKPGADAGWFRRQTARVIVPFAASRSVDAVVTPERLAWFLARRMQVLAPLPPGGVPVPGATTAPPASDGEEQEADDPMAPRRLRYAFFDSFSRFRIEVADTTKVSRRLVSILERRGLAWKLVDVYYVTTP